MATLGEQSIGSIVKLNVNGVATNFIVVHQGNPDSSIYDSSCDGTWLLMDGDCETRVWDSSDNDYANSDIHSYLNNTFINLFDSDIQSIIKQVKLPYINGTGNGGSLASGSNGISAKIFLLSSSEVSGTYSYANTEGAILSYFDGIDSLDRIYYYNGEPLGWYLRSPANISTLHACYINAAGSGSAASVKNAYIIRPALILPYDIEVDASGLINGSVASKPAITGSVTIDDVLKDLTGIGYANIGGVWKELVKTYVNIDGVWKDASEAVENNVTISITQASTASDYCYLQIGDTKYTAVQDITVPSGTKVTFRASSAIDLGGISVNEKLLYQTDLVVQEYVYMDATTNMSIAFEMTGKWNYIHITTEDGKQYAYDTPTSYIVPAKTMTINGTPYAFEEGMTWGEWVDSSYNTGYNGSLFTSSSSLGVFYNIVENGYDMCYQVAYNDQVEGSPNAIVEGREYSLKVTNMGPA